MKHFVWVVISLFGAFSIGSIALHRGESINSAWLVAAAVCTYLVAYRFYSKWITTKILLIDPSRATPAERFNDGRDYVPTNKWIVFGHHFAAISGPGPLIGPTLAAQFGYLPGTLWILFGAVLGGCVQDMVILFLSVRRDGRSLGQMAKDELGRIGGTAAIIGTVTIMIILIAVLGLVVVKAMAHSSWATFTVFATIPIAIFIGFYLRYFRIGRVGEASVIGFALLLLAVVGGEWVKESPALAAYFNMEPLRLAWFVIGYGFIAAVLPVWMLLAPRDYLSTFLKLGTISLLAVAIVIIRPEIKMPALTQFASGSGPIVAGGIFPFLFITIACGAISGFHSLISSGTTSKIIMSEAHIRMVGYGSMALESFVAVMAMIAATVLEPGIYFAINTPLSGGVEAMADKITSWGFPVSTAAMDQLASDMGENSLFGRTGGAPSLAVGMAHIFGSAFGKQMLALWYHFAIMFEAVFILTALDAGTRVARFMLQDVLGNIYKPLGRTSSYPSTLFSSALIVTAWGYFLYMGVIDPYGGINILWPLFGMSNQILAGIALCLATAVIVKSGKKRYVLVTLLPLLWLGIVTTSTGYEKIFNDVPAIGNLATAKLWQDKIDSGVLDGKELGIAVKTVFNNKLCAALAFFFVCIFWLVAVDTLLTCYKFLKGQGGSLSESEYTARA